MKFKDYITEEYNWLSKPKQKFVEKMEKDGRFEIKVSPEKTIMIYRDNKRTKRVTKGLQIFKDGTAIDATVDLSVGKVMRSIKDWEQVMK